MLSTQSKDISSTNSVEVEVLIENVIDDLISKKWYTTWNEFFEKNIQLIRGILYKVYSTDKRVFPDLCDIFRFAENPVDKIKCVFVGMDPYPTAQPEPNKHMPVATGRSFEVGGVFNWFQSYRQASMRNILKSLVYYDTGYEYTMEELRIKNWQGNLHLTEKSDNPHDWFDNMEYRGVVFLNAALTVEEGKPKSHMEIWRVFMDRVVCFIKEQSPDAKWILAGNDAQDRFSSLLPEDNIVRCVHPRMSKFVTQCPFKEVSEVDWTKVYKRIYYGSHI